MKLRPPISLRYECQEDDAKAHGGGGAAGGARPPSKTDEFDELMSTTYLYTARPVSLARARSRSVGD